MSRGAAVRLALFLLLPFAAAPGLGTDGLRLPLALAIAGLGLFTLRRPDLPFAVLAAFCLWQLARFPGGSDLGVVALAVALSTYAAARGVRDRRAVPWVISFLGAALGVAAALGREGLEGNANYAGAVAALLIPPLSSLAAADRGRLRAAALTGLAGAAFALLASESRGGLLAALAGLAVAGAAGARRRGPRSLALPAAVAVVLLAEPLLLRRARYLSEERADTASVRLEIWKGTLRLAGERPWTGCGTGRFAAEFPPFRSEREAAVTQRDAGREFREVEDAHSTWLHVLAETGVPGLALLLGAIGLAAAAGIRRLRTQDAGPREEGWAGLATAFVVAATFNTLHSHVSPWVLFWTAAGLVQAPAEEERSWRSLAAAALAAAPAFALPLWIGFLPAEFRYHAALRAEDPAERVRLLRETGPGPWYFRARFRLAAEEMAAGRLEEADRILVSLLALRPNHGGVLVNYAVVGLRRGESPDRVERILLAARRDAPYYYATEFNLGNLALIGGRAVEARERFRTARRLHSRHAGSAYGEGQSWLLEDRVEEALPALRRARELGMDVGVALRADFPRLAPDSRLAEFFR